MSDSDSTTRPTVVYFIRAGKKGPIKIGKTSKPLAVRLSQLQSGSFLRLRVTGVTAAYTEMDLHKRFASARIRRRNEWFRATPELLAFIAENTMALSEDLTPPVAPPPAKPLGFATLIQAEFRTTHDMPSRRRGRPAHPDVPGYLDRAVECARERYLHRTPRADLALFYDVSEGTIKRWCNEALASDHPEAAGLRRVRGVECAAG